MSKDKIIEAAIVSARLGVQLPAEALPLLIDYDAHTGAMAWRERGPEWGAGASSFNSKWAGKAALRASTLKGGRKGGQLMGKMAVAARVAYAIHNGHWPKGYVQHKDGDIDNLRGDNLVDVAPSEVMTRSRAGRLPKRDSKGRYRVKIGSAHVGSFKTEAEVIAVKLGAKKALPVGP